jgi:glycine oxidase
MLAPGGEISERTSWAELALASLEMYPRYVQELSEQTGISIDYRRPGGVDLAFNDAEWGVLVDRSRRQNELGIRSELLDGRQLSILAPTVPAGRGLYYPDDALVDPVPVMTALRKALDRSGVRIMERTAVRRIVPATNAITVHSVAATLSSRFAVLSAGAWSGLVPVEGISTPESYPVKGHLLGYDLAPGSLPAILRWEHTYILQRSSGFTVAGSTIEHAGFDQTVDAGKVSDISRRAGSVLPLLNGLKPSRAWVGLRPATAALKPEIRRLPGSNLWLAYGHYRNGILLAPVTAQQVASEISSAS